MILLAIFSNNLLSIHIEIYKQMNNGELDTGS